MGCGCNNNFNAAKKPCSCGRNAGGNCQCNNKKLNASGKKYRCRDILGNVYYSDKPCPNIYLDYPSGAKQGGNDCPPPLVMDANGNCVQEGLGGDPTRRIKRKLNAKGRVLKRRRGEGQRQNPLGRHPRMPREGENLKSFAKSIGYDINVVSGRVGCDCTCSGQAIETLSGSEGGSTINGWLLKCKGKSGGCKGAYGS